VGLTSALLAAVVTEVYCHRCLAHRSYAMHARLATVLDMYFKVIVGTNPATWAVVHRTHHRYADTPRDPHSPRVRRPISVLAGSALLFAQARRRLLGDQPVGRERAHLIWRGVITAFFLVTCGVEQVIVMLVVHLATYLGVQGMVNTVGHLYGTKPYPDAPGYDLAVLAIPLLGHGYHNSHHAHPEAARTGALDPIWPLLLVLHRMRLITIGGQAGRPAVLPECSPQRSGWTPP